MTIVINNNNLDHLLPEKLYSFECVFEGQLQSDVVIERSSDGQTGFTTVRTITPSEMFSTTQDIPSVEISDSTSYFYRFRQASTAEGDFSVRVLNQEYDTTALSGQGVPTGGTTGQVLAKIDGTDYNTEWVDQSSGGGGSSYQVLRVELNSQLDINSSTSGFTLTFNLLGIVLNILTGSTVQASQIDLPAGTYRVTLNANTNSLVQRSNVGWRLNVNGSEYSVKNGSNYNRATVGHNETGDTFTDVFTLAQSGNISIQAYRQANTGLVALENTSYLIVEKLA